MDFHNIEEINEIVSKIPFIEVLEEFKQIEIFCEGKVSVNNIEGLNESLIFDVQILPQYPLKSHDSEAIKFINKELVPYNHVMGDGSICIHTLHSPKLKHKLHGDFESLKSWIDKYYINNGKDVHYEHIIVNEQPFNDVYYSYQFTDVDYTFSENEFGEVQLIPLNDGVYKKKVISNFLIKSFQSVDKREKIICKWSDHYMNYKVQNSGLFIFLNDVPAVHNRFAFSNWLELKNFFPDNFLNLLYDFKKKHKKDINAFVPVFLGYTTINEEIHWNCILIKVAEIPMVGVPIVNSDGIKLKGQWKGELVNKSIDWGITRNSSYKYLYGRGTFCEKITNAKILIIGVGAIGSIVAKTLVKCGAKSLSVVDYDVKEPENVCRSEYTFSNGLYDKTIELMKILREDSPFVEVRFHNNYEYFESFIKSFRKDKKTKAEYEKSLSHFDLVFNCSADSDLMFVLDQLNLNTNLINLSLTNHAKDLVCAFYPNIYKFVQNQFINILDNDVEDLYNPTGCWSSTFKASYNDISLLVQYALKEINTKYKEDKPKDNFTLSIDYENITNIKFTQY